MEPHAEKNLPAPLLSLAQAPPAASATPAPALTPRRVLRYNFYLTGYRETIAYLFGLQHHGIKLGLDNPRRLLALLGDPQEGFNSVHIAGTSGKGSASAMLYSMLRASGLLGARV